MTYDPNSCFVMDRQMMHLGGNMKGGDPHCWCPELWQWLLDRYNPKLVVDVGCGTGESLRWFAERINAIGIEGLTENATACNAPVIVHDLTNGPIALDNVDLVWCCEVAEHIDERYVGNLLDALCCGRVIAMTAARPGQGGFHHVNEQPPEYWIEKIESRGFIYDRFATGAAKGLSPDPRNWFSLNGMVFVRGAA